MHQRPARILLLALLLGAATAISGCGFNMGTEREYSPGVGTNFLDGTVDVLGAVIVSTTSTPGEGIFIASLSNGSPSEEIMLTNIEAPAGEDLTATLAAPVVVAPLDLVNMADGGGVPVQGQFVPGDFVGVDVVFSNGEKASIKVPVVLKEGPYSSVAPAPKLTPEPKPANSPSPRRSPGSH